MDLSPLNSNYTFTGLNSNTQYRMRLFTQGPSTPSSDFRDITSITHPPRIFHFPFFLSFLFFPPTFSSSHPKFIHIWLNKKLIAVSGIQIEKITYNSVRFTMEPSPGALTYSAKVFNQEYNFLSFFLKKIL